MTFGEQLRKLRNSANFSQPELADLVGIEQSYLSKLENDKSIPSNEVFRKLLKAFKTNIGEFVAAINLSKEKSRLMQIPDIELWINQQNQGSLKNQRQYLYICSALIVVAATLFYIGFSKQLFSETYFEYQSEGIVLEGEPNNIFDAWAGLINDDDIGEKIRLVREAEVEINKRRDPILYLADSNKGQFFVEKVTGGKRFFKFSHTRDIARPVNSWLKAIGVLLFTMGIMGFILERRLFKL